MKTLVIEVLVYAALTLALAASWLMLRMRDEYQMLHFLSPPASLSAIFITVAIFLQQGRKPESFKALFIVGILLMINSVVTHATARAFRLRKIENWRPREGEEVPVQAGDKPVAEEK